MSNQTFNQRPDQTVNHATQTQNYQRYPSPNSWDMETSGPLDVKDLEIIKDQLNHEALAYKKWSVYSGYFKDQTLTDIACATAQHHKQHFDVLQNYLNSHR